MSLNYYFKVNQNVFDLGTVIFLSFTYKYKINTICTILHFA